MNAVSFNCEKQNLVLSINSRSKKNIYIRRLFALVCITAIGLFSSFHAHSKEVSQTAKTHQLSHMDGLVTIDGQLNEAFWQQATQIELAYENDPGEGTRALVKTQAYLYENGDSLFIAFKAFDPKPSQIRGNLSDRDDLWSDDFVGVIIDTFNDERGAYQFFVNPVGVQADARLNDTDGWNSDDSWDAIWHSAASVNEEGWTVEMRIPFSALRFEENQDKKKWGIALQRVYPRDIRHRLENFSKDRNLVCTICQFDKIEGFQSIKSTQSFQLTPTITMTRDDSKPEVPGDWEIGDIHKETGLDLRWNITQDNVLNATINPDFSQVEADATQLDVNRTYSLFIQEKRAFFLDGADYFSTNNFNLVHTRNIADPDYGIKLTGKNGDHSYGVLVSNDQQTTFLLPGNQGSSVANYTDESGSNIDSQIAIARYKVDVGERNNVGFLATSREGKNYSNQLVSIDGSYWLSEEDSVQYQYSYSNTVNPQSLLSEYSLKEKQQDYAVGIDYSHGTRDYNLTLGYKDVGSDFRADMGFVGKTGYKALQFSGEKTYFGEESETFNRLGYFGSGDITYDQHGKQLSRSVEFLGFANGPMQFYANFGLIAGDEFYQNEYNQEGEYFSHMALSGFTTITPLPGLELRLSGSLGQQIDYANANTGQKLNTWLTIDWSVNKNLNLNLNHFFNRMNVDASDFLVEGELVQLESGRLFTANKSNLGLTYQFNIQSQLRLTVQYTDITRDESLYLANHDINDNNDVGDLSRYFSTQLLYSYKVNPQTLLYVGYSDGGFQSAESDQLERDQRSFFVKFSYAFQGE